MMKKLFIALCVLLSAFSVKSQTVSEITNILNTKPQSVAVTSATANNSNLFSLDLGSAGYKLVQITITGTWSATVSFQGSSDNFTTVDAINVYNTTAGTWSTSTTSNGTFAIPVYGYRYIRVRTTAFTSGSVDGVAYAKLNNVELPTYNAGTQTVSGTVTANAGTNLNTSLLALESGGNLASLEAKDFATQTTLSALNTKIPSNLTVTANRLQVDIQSIPAGTNNIGDVDVLTVPADPFGVNADAASATGSISAKLRFIAATGIPVTSLPSVTIGTFPDNEPFNVAQINGITPLMGNGVTGTGSLRVTIASDNTAFTVNAAQSGTWNINNISGTVSLPTGASTLAEQQTQTTALQLLDNIVLGQASTTSGQSGILGMGAVTTAAPTYTTTQTNPLSLQTDGSLRTAVTNTVTVATHAVTQSGGWVLSANSGVDIGDVTINNASGASAVNIQDGGNTITVDGTVSITANSAVNVAQINGVTPLMGNGVTGTGSPRVTLVSDGTAISTTGFMSVKLDQTTPGTTNGASLVPTASGGLTTYHLVSAATTNATNIKASAGQVYGWYIFNANAAARKVAFHNTSGTPTAGASVFYSLVIPAGSAANVEFTQGLAFSSGIGITTTTGTGDSDATAVAAGDLIINIYYK